MQNNKIENSEYVKELKKAANDESLIFDGFDMNGRELFISKKNENLEYTIDYLGNFWKHNGFTEKKIGEYKLKGI